MFSLSNILCHKDEPTEPSPRVLVRILFGAGSFDDYFGEVSLGQLFDDIAQTQGEVDAEHKKRMKEEQEKREKELLGTKN